MDNPDIGKLGHTRQRTKTQKNTVQHRKRKRFWYLQFWFSFMYKRSTKADHSNDNDSSRSNIPTYMAELIGLFPEPTMLLCLTSICKQIQITQQQKIYIFHLFIFLKTNNQWLKLYTDIYVTMYLIWLYWQSFCLILTYHLFCLF